MKSFMNEVKLTIKYIPNKKKKILKIILDQISILMFLADKYFRLGKFTSFGTIILTTLANKAFINHLRNLISNKNYLCELNIQIRPNWLNVFYEIFTRRILTLLFLYHTLHLYKNFISSNYIFTVYLYSINYF